MISTQIHHRIQNKLQWITFTVYFSERIVRVRKMRQHAAALIPPTHKKRRKNKKKCRAAYY